MYCPEGYFTLYEVYQEFAGAAFDYVSANPPPSTPPPTPGGFYFDTGADFDAKEEAYREWLFQNFLYENSSNFYAFHPKSEIVRLSQELVASVKLFHGPFPDTPEARASMVEHVRDQLLWIEQQAFTIDPSRRSDSENEESFLAIPYFKTVALVAGWIVCWRPPSWPFELSKLAEICAAYDAALPQVTNVQRGPALKRGRPKLAGVSPEIAVLNEFRGRKNRGELSLKKQATYREAQDWAKKILEVDVAENTMARYLIPLWSDENPQK